MINMDKNLIKKAETYTKHLFNVYGLEYAPVMEVNDRMLKLNARVNEEILIAEKKHSIKDMTILHYVCMLIAFENRRHNVGQWAVNFSGSAIMAAQVLGTWGDKEAKETARVGWETMKEAGYNTFMLQNLNN